MRINVGRERRPSSLRPSAAQSFARLCRGAHPTLKPTLPQAHIDLQRPTQPLAAAHTGPSDAGPSPEEFAAPTVPLHVVTYARDGHTVITAVGELDIATAPRLAETLRRTPARAPIILDLTGVTFMDCAGLHPILHAHYDIARRTPLILVPTPAISRLLRLADIQHVLRSRPTVLDALTCSEMNHATVTPTESRCGRPPSSTEAIRQRQQPAV